MLRPTGIPMRIASSTEMAPDSRSRHTSAMARIEVRSSSVNGAAVRSFILRALSVPTCPRSEAHFYRIGGARAAQVATARTAWATTAEDTVAVPCAEVARIRPTANGDARASRALHAARARRARGPRRPRSSCVARFRMCVVRARLLARVARDAHAVETRRHGPRTDRTVREPDAADARLRLKPRAANGAGRAS